MTYLLNREAMRVVERNDRGMVTYRKRYRKGDEVDTDHMDPTHVENLVESGALVESEDDLTEEGATTDASEGAAAPASVPGDLGSTATGAPEEPQSRVDEDGGKIEEVDEFSSMDYSELQQAAKGKGLNAGGSAEELRARLRADAEGDLDDEA